MNTKIREKYWYKEKVFKKPLNVINGLNMKTSRCSFQVCNIFKLVLVNFISKYKI